MYLQVNALSEWIIGIYLHDGTVNEREISTPHDPLPSAVLKILNSLLVSPDNLQAMSASTFFLFKLNTF